MAAITIIGTGHMAKGIATVAFRGGYEVIFHSRDPQANEAEVKGLTGATDSNVSLVPYGSDVTTELVVLAVPYAASEEATKDYADKFAGKVVIDISNPINWSKLELIVPAAGSSAEQIASVAPQARVVKGFNTINFSLFETGKAGGLPLDVFIAGDDETAKQQVIAMINAGGLRGVDCGPLVQARDIESLEHWFVNTKLGGDGPKAIKIVGD